MFSEDILSMTTYRHEVQLCPIHYQNQTKTVAGDLHVPFLTPSFRKMSKSLFTKDVLP